MLVRVLLNETAPDAARPGQQVDDAALAALYGYPSDAAERPWVRANFVATLDGAVTGDDGRSGSINTGADRAIFSLLRSLSDVVLVGAATVRAEEYRRARTAPRWSGLRRADQPPHPVVAVVSRSANLPSSILESRADAGDALLLTCRAAGSAALDRARRALGDERVVVLGEDGVAPDAALKALTGRGLCRVLCEGGPHLLHDLVAADLLDELCLTLAPRLVAGDHLRMLAGTPLDRPFLPRLLVESEGTLAGRWQRRRS
ncbi:pyrimidine reductase family protein [Thermobifida halotolerans]